MNKYTLHLINDDINHHADVQLALIDVCNLDASEAEAFTYVAHLEGSFPIVEEIDQREANRLKERFDNLSIQTQITEMGSQPF